MSQKKKLLSEFDRGLWATFRRRVFGYVGATVNRLLASLERKIGTIDAAFKSFDGCRVSSQEGSIPNEFSIGNEVSLDESSETKESRAQNTFLAHFQALCLVRQS